MLKTEEVIINAQRYLHNYSDAGFMIERDGVKYGDAIDPIDSGRVYVETDIPVGPSGSMDEETEAYAEAGKILMGVME